MECFCKEPHAMAVTFKYESNQYTGRKPNWMPDWTKHKLTNTLIKFVCEYLWICRVEPPISDQNPIGNL